MKQIQEVIITENIVVFEKRLISGFRRLIMGDFQLAYKTVRPSIVGIGFSDFQENSHIIGTGFIIHPSGWIMSKSTRFGTSSGNH